MRLRTWSHGTDNFAAAGVAPAPLKILLKTKDDPWLIRRWIDHHAAVVGRGNLVILDNGSTDAAVLAVYDGLGGEVPLFRFAEPMDCVHMPALFPDLYDGLRRTCRAFIFLDTDEFLVGLQDTDRLLEPARLAEAVAAFEGRTGDFVPTTWLSNVPGSAQAYWVGKDRTLVDGLTWGKPLIRSAAVPREGLINHNVQLAGLGARPLPDLRLLTLHCNSLHPRQRIAGNLNKLKSFGLLPTEGTVEEALALAASAAEPGANGNLKAWVDEIARLVPMGEHFPDHLTGQSHPHLTLAGPTVTYAGKGARETMAGFVAAPAAMLARAGVVAPAAAADSLAR